MYLTTIFRSNPSDVMYYEIYTDYDGPNDVIIQGVRTTREGAEALIEFFHTDDRGAGVGPNRYWIEETRRTLYRHLLENFTAK